MVVTEVPAEARENRFFDSEVPIDEFASSFFKETQNFLRRHDFNLPPSGEPAIVYQTPAPIIEGPVVPSENQQKAERANFSTFEWPKDLTYNYPVVPGSPDFDGLTPAEAKAVRRLRRETDLPDRLQVTSLVFGTTETDAHTPNYQWQIHAADSITTITINSSLQLGGWRIGINHDSSTTEPMTLDKKGLLNAWGAVIEVLYSNELADRSRELTLRRQDQQMAVNRLENTHIVRESLPLSYINPDLVHVIKTHTDERSVEVATIEVTLVGEALEKELTKERERLAVIGFMATKFIQPQLAA